MMDMNIVMGFVLMFAGSFIMRLAVRRFLPEKRGRIYKAGIVILLAVLFGLSSWVGDENPLIVLPFYLAVFLLCYTGPWYARLTIGVIFYTLLLPINMLLDSAQLHENSIRNFVLLSVRLALWVVICLLIMKFVPAETEPMKSKRLWILLGALSLAPLFATLSFSIWNVRGFEEGVYYAVALRISYTILPFAMLSAAALLAADVVLSRHEELERRQRLAEMQAVYYRGLQQEQRAVRALRHDMNNHIAAALGLLEREETAAARSYLRELSGAPALTGTMKICENEIADAVLTSKAAVMAEEGLEGKWQVSLPPALAIDEIELSTLLGSALDNAIEAAREAEDKTITVSARADKGGLMLRVENGVGRPPRAEGGKFVTTKEDTAAHGFGLPGMGDIARRYDGALEARAEGGRFELVVYLRFQEEAETF